MWLTMRMKKMMKMRGRSVDEALVFSSRPQSHCLSSSSHVCLRELPKAGRQMRNKRMEAGEETSMQKV